MDHRNILVNKYMFQDHIKRYCHTEMNYMDLPEDSIEL